MLGMEIRVRKAIDSHKGFNIGGGTLTKKTALCAVFDAYSTLTLPVLAILTALTTLPSNKKSMPVAAARPLGM